MRFGRRGRSDACLEIKREGVDGCCVVSLREVRGRGEGGAGETVIFVY